MREREAAAAVSGQEGAKKATTFTYRLRAVMRASSAPPGRFRSRLEAVKI